MATEVRANDGRGLPRYGSGVEGELLAGPVLEDCRSVRVRVQHFGVSDCADQDIYEGAGST